MAKKGFIVFLFLIFGGGLSAQVDTVKVQDFSNNWVFFNGSEILPLVKKSDFSGNIISFSVDKTSMQDALIRVSHPKAYSVFVNDELIETGSGDIYLDLNDLGINDSEINLTVYSKELNPYLLITSALKLVDQSLSPISNDVVIVNPRSKESFKSFYIAAWIIILVYLAALLTYYPRMLDEYFRVTRAFSPRELDENLLKNRIFTGTNISFYVFISLSLGLLIISTIHLSGLFPEQLRYYPDTMLMGLINWLFISLLVLASILLKYIIISVFTSLFQLKDFLSNHFYNFLRLGLIITMPLNVFIGVVYFGIYQYPHTIYQSVYSLLLYASLLVVAIIYLKLMNSGGYKNLHLFSYLCGTELIPYVIILNLGIY
ncbi:DUF4271 domain-containing protein [Fulvivirga lutea]|uniref:DUF4271 domain-containing protein n=1 Tax=Fulvivirga lutea TaxID=2810512 RepID=A0A975A1K2_9BACT|nr:DUF4271 domain-containing protein [Fulvivirga lutea]QSE98335.1 DUF4271 domain-containing protein [Fulvivirga lutea]